MGSLGRDGGDKPHAVCVPFPAQGHINPMLKLAKLLHHRGFHITFVNTDFNHRRLLKSRGSAALDGLPTFRFASIPDGLPPTDADATQDIPALCDSTRRTCLAPFMDILTKLNADDDVPPVSCIVSDGCLSFTLDAAEQLQIPEALFWTTSACGFLSYVHYKQLIDRGYTPMKDENYLTNGYLDTIIDWIPGIRNIRLKDLPSFIRTTDPDFIMLDFVVKETERSRRGSAVILNTFDALEQQALDALSSILPPVLSIGPLHLLLNQIKDDQLKQIGSNLWREEPECLRWLESREPDSVVYVNFGSITVMTPNQLLEFAWGLANSKKPFLWVIRPDLVSGDAAVLPPEFVEETRDRGMLARWCPQEEVLSHPAVAVFLTHSGWNSTLESISYGVPMICWPFFAEQQTNCWFCKTEWGIGMEIDGDVKRAEVERQVREVMDGEQGREMKKHALEWKRKAEEATATATAGSSCTNLDRLVQQFLLPQRQRALTKKKLLKKISTSTAE